MNKNIFFTSDTHFGHGNIIKYCNRPWHGENSQTGDIIVRPEDIEQMDEELIERWNNTVSTDSIVWHLGDFSLGRGSRIAELVSRLNGRINLVMGNHDHNKLSFYYKSGFNRVYDRPVIINEFVVLSHAPMPFVRGPFYNIFGHVHDAPSVPTWTKDSCCVCVERHDYRPISWAAIQKNHDMLNDSSEQPAEQDESPAAIA